MSGPYNCHPAASLTKYGKQKWEKLVKAGQAGQNGLESKPVCYYDTNTDSDEGDSVDSLSLSHEDIVRSCANENGLHASNVRDQGMDSTPESYTHDEEHTSADEERIQIPVQERFEYESCSSEPMDVCQMSDGGNDEDKYPSGGSSTDSSQNKGADQSDDDDDDDWNRCWGDTTISNDRDSWTYTVEDARKDGLFSSDEEDDETDESTSERQQNEINPNDVYKLFGLFDQSTKADSDFQKLFEPVMIENTVSPASLLRMILQFSFKNNVCFSGIVNLAKLMNMAIGTRMLPDTRYLFDKVCGSYPDHTLHAVCERCSLYVDKFDGRDAALCPQCRSRIDLSNRSNSCYFAIIDPSDSARDYVEAYDDHYDYVVNKRVHDPNHMKDMYDADFYREFVEELPESERRSYGSFSMFADGVRIFENGNRSIWVIYLMINELPPQARLDNMIVVGLWVGRSKPIMHIFLDKFVECMEKLSSDGIKCTIKGEERVIKFYVIVSAVDTMARYEMNATVVFHAEFGCDWCFEIGKRYANSNRYPYRSDPAVLRDEDKHMVCVEKALESGEPYLGVRYLSPLINLRRFKIVNGFVPEYMHQYLAGCVKQITMCIWRRMKPASRLLIDDLLVNTRFPTQLGRLTSKMSLHASYKCKDWENWALYSSVPMLSEITEDEKFEKILENWSLLVDSLHLALKDDINMTEIASIKVKLIEFVKDIKHIYSLKELTYNIHQLLHIIDSIINWGPLWAHAAFGPESFNGKLVNCIHSEKGIILQILRHIQLHRFDQLLMNKEDPSCNKIVDTYCRGIVGSKSNKVLKIGNITYLGVPLTIQRSQADEFNVRVTTKTFTRCVISGCLYMTDAKENTRSCNYFAQLKNGSFIKISQFLVDLRDSRQLTVCRLIDVVDHRYSCTVKEMISTSHQLQIVPTEDISRICVHVRTDTKEFITPVPNLLHY